MDQPLDFKKQFYSLQGIHISERKKNFNKLLLSTTSLTLDASDDQLDIQPRNYQENIFYVDVLIHFRKVEKLMEILKEGIGVLTSRILKQQWFFQEAFENISEEDIVNNILPSLSFSLRMKVLKKLSLTFSEERMDKIFDLILKRYGLFIAKQFLFSCSKEKIINVLRNNEITLPTEQLKRLLQKDVDLLKVFFEEYKKNKKMDFWDHDFLNYLVWKYPKLYFEMGLNNKYHIKMGRFTTRAILKSNKEDILKDIKNQRFNRTSLVRDVEEFDKKYFHLFFPDDINAINTYAYNSNLNSFASKYPIRKRWEVISKAFKQAYDKDIAEYLHLFDENLARYSPENIQVKWAQIKFLETDDLKYIKYYDPKTAFKLLKDKINVTSDINQRGRLLNELISVCYNKQDYSTYEAVLKHICTRHRNEDKNVRAILISHLDKKINYADITEAHWKYINELVDIARIRDENLPFKIIVEYLLFACKKQIPLDGPVTQYAKDCIKNERTFRLGYRKKEPEVERIILKEIVKILPTIEQPNLKRFTYQIMSNMVDFNSEIKNDKNLNMEFNRYWIDLNECPLIVELVNQLFTKQIPYDFYDYEIVKTTLLYNCLYSETPLKVSQEQNLLGIVETIAYNADKRVMIGHCLSKIITKPRRNDFENSLLKLFFTLRNDEYAFSFKHKAIKYFLNKEPEVLAHYIHYILPIDVNSQSGTHVLNYRIIKLYSHLRLDEKVIAHFKVLVSVTSKCDRKVKLLNILSRVMNTKDFLDLVKEYTPKSIKLDLNNEDQKDMYKVQCAIAKAFKNLEDMSVIPPVVMEFCQGDYLQSSLPALYKALYRINEQKAFSHINVLGERAISARKHAFFLGFQLLSLKDATTLFSVLSNKETNISVKKYLFSAILKYFLRNPLESVLDIVVRSMGFVDKNDSEMIHQLVGSVNNIPLKYKAPFFEKVWNFMGILEEQEVKVTNFRKILLNNINSCGPSVILMLNKNFCEDLIKKYFLSSDDTLQRISLVLDYFVINYLLANLDETYFEFVFNIIKSYTDIHWESHDKDPIALIFTFFSSAYRRFDENDVKFLKLFTSFWQRLFSYQETFSEYTLLRLMALYKENPNIETFSREVDKCFQELITEHGPHIGALLISCVKDFFPNIPTKYDTDFNLENFAFYLLLSSSSEFNCSAVFCIIKNFNQAAQKNIYSKVVNALKVIPNSTARIYCNILLKKKV